MAPYNPNSVWGSPKKEYRYEPPAEAERPVGAAKSSGDSGGAPGGGAGSRDPVRPPRKSHAVLWASIVFFAIFLAGVFYIFFMRTPAGPNVAINFAPPSQILTGDPFSITVTISNYSSNILKGASLSILLPDNISFAAQGPSQRVMDQSLGDLGPGSVSPQTFTLIATGNPDSVQHLTAKLVYSTDASPKSQFETDGGADLLVGGPAIGLNFAAPSAIFSGQNFSLVLGYTNNTSHAFQNVVLAAQYPPTFTFTGSTVPPSGIGNNTWDLGTVPAAGSGSITIMGNVVGPENASYALQGTLTGDVGGNAYTLTNQTATLTLGASPLGLSVALTNGADYVASAGDTLTYAITYTNTSNVTFQNVTLKAALVGSMYDFSTLQTNGSFSSVSNVVTWYGANTPALLAVAPGASGTVNIQVKAKPSFPIRLLSDKNYALRVSARISSPTVPPGTSASSTVSVATLDTKVGGAVALTARAYRSDAKAGIVNAGPYPPRVNQTTEYTIHWDITNYSTDLASTTVSAYLQSGTTCTGKITSNVSAAPTCDSATGLVSWTLPFIPATTGVIGAPAEAIIQVANTPAVNQVGQSVTLLGATTLTGTDVYTGETLTAKANPVNTDIPYDTSISQNADRHVAQ